MQIMTKQKLTTGEMLENYNNFVACTIMSGATKSGRNINTDFLKKALKMNSVELTEEQEQELLFRCCDGLATIIKDFGKEV